MKKCVNDLPYASTIMLSEDNWNQWSDELTPKIAHFNFNSKNFFKSLIFSLMQYEWEFWATKTTPQWIDGRKQIWVSNFLSLSENTFYTQIAHEELDPYFL